MRREETLTLELELVGYQLLDESSIRLDQRATSFYIPIGLPHRKAQRAHDVGDNHSGTP